MIHTWYVYGQSSALWALYENKCKFNDRQLSEVLLGGCCALSSSTAISTDSFAVKPQNVIPEKYKILLQCDYNLSSKLPADRYNL